MLSQNTTLSSCNQSAKIFTNRRSSSYVIFDNGLSGGDCLQVDNPLPHPLYKVGQ